MKTSCARFSFLALFLACAVLSGCGGKPARSGLAISGKVTLDSQPLDQGLVQFLPQQADPKAVIVAASVTGGTYSVPVEAGLLPGTYKVSITSKPQAGATSTDPVKAMQEASAPPPPDRIPPKYNNSTELQIAVKQEGPFSFDFDLKSK